MWADNETDQDLLGFSIHADLLRSIVTNPELLPVTVGLFGDWGGGKTSILKILKGSLEKEDDIAVIYFDSWIFEGYEDAKSAILGTLLHELKNHRRLRHMIGDEAKDLLRRVKLMKLLKVGASVGFAYASANPLPLLLAGGDFAGAHAEIDTEGKQDKPMRSSPEFSGLLADVEATVCNIRSFRADFREMLKKTKLRSLVILIDDLDRCSPERLIENLEAIKLFLNVEQTAFVIAADRRIVENAIRIRYSNLFASQQSSSPGDALVVDYLEKLIQVPYTLPKLAPHEVRSYLCMLFLKKHLPRSNFESVLKSYVQFLSEDRYTAFQLKDELHVIEDDSTRSTVEDSMRLVEACCDAITDGLKGNPRQIKRFLNAFWLRRQLAAVSKLTHLKDHLLIKLMVLEYISRERFEELYQWHRQSDDGRAEPLTRVETSDSIETIPDEFAGWTTPRIWRWVQTQPMLSTVDLRDYFWVARSALADTFSGVRLMSQAMRICAEELLSSLEVQRKSGIKMFQTLSEDEQDAVLGVVIRRAMQTPDDDTPLRSLLDLTKDGHFTAAQGFSRCIDRIGAEFLPPGLGITLRKYEIDEQNRATVLVAEIREKLAKTKTKIGRALQRKKETR